MRISATLKFTVVTAFIAIAAIIGIQTAHTATTHTGTNVSAAVVTATDTDPGVDNDPWD
jgi:hypothetical protein